MYVEILLYFYFILVIFWDIKYLKIPNTLLFVFFTLVFTIFISDYPFLIIERIVTSCFFLLMFYIVFKFTNGLGAGDVKLVFVLSFWFGFSKIIFSLIFACFFSLVFFLILYLLQKKKKKLPFAPFVGLGFVIVKIFIRFINV